MTIRNPKTIAIIGAGPGGLASAYEFLNTKESGVPAFDKVVVFEQKDHVGGVWVFNERADEVTDELIHSEYWNPEKVHPVLNPPADLTHHTVDSPLETPALNNDNQWRRSGVYPKLYTNVPRRFMRFSSIPFQPREEKTVIQPLITHQEVNQVLEKFADDNDLKKHIRLQTQVQGVSKEDDQWVLTLRRNNGATDQWYREAFDAVVVSTGHYSTPYIPYIPGLDTRDSGSISHSKSFRASEQFKDKTVFIVGSSLSGIDIVQYIDVIGKVVISRTPGKKEIYPWLEKAAEASETRPRITEIKGKLVTFEDNSELEADHIIFATGYHWRWPFLNNQFIELTTPGHNDTATGSSRVGGLYYNIFTIEDPTLGFVGVTLGSTKFQSLEAAAVALAGVWSGQRSLPSKEQQYKWEQQRIAETGDNIFFHYYDFHYIKEQWFDPVIEKFAVPGRVNPLEGEDIGDLDRALESAERVYFGVKAGDATYDNLHL
jgi:cation diffusion facilitator CzcD-associated flavoprotein CzcO